MLDFNFLIPTQIRCKNKILSHCQNEIEKIFTLGSNIMLCIGKGSVKKNNLLNKLLKQLKNYKIVLFEGIEPNPTTKKAEEGLQLAKNEKIQGIIGLGGGSTLDTAKAIATAYTNNLSIQDLWSGQIKINQKCLPLILIPTTPATSSELNQYSVLTSTNGIKKGFGHKPQMCPDLALIDPELILTLSKTEKQASLCDILAHALEASWSKKSNELYKFFAHKAIVLILEFGPIWIQKPQDYQSAEKITFASILAGLAFSHTGTTVCHALSYPFTILHNLKHGIGCGITLPIFYEYFGEKSDFQALNQVLKVKTPKDGRIKLEKFLKKIEIKTSLNDWGITKEDLSQIIEEAYPYKNEVNPVKISKKEMQIILKQIQS